MDQGHTIREEVATVTRLLGTAASGERVLLEGQGELRGLYEGAVPWEKDGGTQPLRPGGGVRRDGPLRLSWPQTPRSRPPQAPSTGPHILFPAPLLKSTCLGWDGAQGRALA